MSRLVRRLAGVLMLAAAAARCGSATSPSCTFTVSPSTLSVPPAGGAASVTVSTSSACAWTTASNVPWIGVLNALPRTGTGTVQLLVTPNLTGSRSGTVSVAGQAIVVSQTALATFTLSGTVKEGWTNAGLGAVTVSVAPGPGFGTAVTDSGGFYSLGALPAGTYSVSFSKPSFSPNVQPVKVAGDTSFSTILNPAITFPFTTADLSSGWAGGGPYPNEPMRLTLIQTGSQLSGFYIDRHDVSDSVSGTTNGRDAVFRVNVADGALLFECTIDDARHMHGVLKNERLGGNFPIVLTR